MLICSPGQHPYHPFLRVKSHPSGQTANDAAFGRLEAWLLKCVNGHEKYRQGDGDHIPHLPHRILFDENNDNNRSKPQAKIRLVEGITAPERYACLSHRWGEGPNRYALQKPIWISSRVGYQRILYLGYLKTRLL